MTIFRYKIYCRKYLSKSWLVSRQLSRHLGVITFKTFRNHYYYYFFRLCWLPFVEEVDLVFKLYHPLCIPFPLQSVLQLLLSQSIIYICVCWFFFIHSLSTDTGCFHVLAVENSAGINIGVHVFFGIMVLSWYMTRHGTTG